MNAMNAMNAVTEAKRNPESWIGDHDEQVIFANGVFTVASNGDAEDFETAEEAAIALEWQWQEEERSRE